MSQEQYTAIAKTRLIDVNLIPEAELIKYLSINSGWAIKMLLKQNN